MDAVWIVTMAGEALMAALALRMCSNWQTVWIVGVPSPDAVKPSVTDSLKLFGVQSPMAARSCWWGFVPCPSMALFSKLPEAMIIGSLPFVLNPALDRQRNELGTGYFGSPK